MKKVLFILFAIISLNSQAEREIIKNDSTIKIGKLQNGLTYYIKHNAQTKGIADFYIAQRVGSILEEPRQRGLAHFLEHMAFNGTKNFIGNSEKPSIVKWCESVGIKFGVNLNAYTSVDQTVYNISSVPISRQGVIDSCLLILSDWSHNLLLTDKEIDKERGVVQEEWRTRRTGMAMQRLAEQSMPIIYKGTKYADCMPIGNMNIIQNFKYKDLRDYYKRWYRPDLQAIIVVGDIDVNQIENKIKKLFNSIPKPINPAKRIYYPIPDNKRMIIYSATDTEQPTVNFTLYMKRDITKRENRNTIKKYSDDFITNIIRMAINDRIEMLVRKENSPFISASVRDGNFFLASTKDVFEISAVLKENMIEEGIEQIIAEIQRVKQWGLTNQEIELGKKELLSYAESGYNDKDNRRNGDFVEQCINNFLENEPIISPEIELSLVEKLNKSVKLNDVNSVIKEIITNKNQVVTLYAPRKKALKLPKNNKIEKIILTAQKRKYDPYKEKILDSNLISNLPQKGSIISQNKFKYGYTEYILSNGVKVYIKPTEFEADEIRVKFFSKGGKNIYPNSDMPNLTYLISGATIGGAGRYDDLTLEKMLTGKSVSVTPFINDETEGMDGYSNKKDIKTLFELIYLYFTQPRKDEKAFKNLMEQQKEFLTNAFVNPMIEYNDTLHKIAFATDRLRSMNAELIKQVDYNRIMQIYKERFGNAADFQLIITGNVDINKTKDLLCQYIATLPYNNIFENVGTKGAKLVDGKITHIFKKKQATPTTTTTIVIKGNLDYNDRNDLIMDAIGQILRIVYTDKVREDKGGTYGVEVNGSLQHLPYNEAMIRIAFQTDPKKYAQLIPIIDQQLQNIAENGPKQEDLDKVKAYELKIYKQVLKMNNYWEYVLYNDLYNGIDLDTNFEKIVNEMTTKDIQKILKKILEQNNRIQVTMTQDEEDIK